MRKFIFAAALLLLGASAVHAAPPVNVCDRDNPANCAKPDSSGNLPITGSISASLAGFNPTAGATANITDIVNVSQDAALPAGTDFIVTNKGSVDVNFRTQAGAGTAVSTDQTLKAGAAIGLHITTQTHLSAIAPTGTGTGSTAGQLNIQGGTGLAAGYGGGGSSSSGSGTSVAQGSTTSGQNVSPMGCRTLTSAPTDTTAQTNMPWCTTKGSQVVAQPTAADLNVTATQGGTWTVQPGNTANTTAWKVDGSAVTQPTSHASGSVASGAYASGSIASGAYASGSIASGAFASGAISNGADVVEGNNTDSAACTSGTSLIACTRQIHADAIAAIPAGTNLIGKVGFDQTTPGTTNAVQNISGTTGGVTAFTLTAAASTNATNVKASAGTLYHIAVYNNSATLAWVSFYNTSGTPTCGTSIVYQTMIPANSTSGAGAVEDFATGMNFSSGIGICVTTGIAGTGSVAATSYVVGLGYK